MDIKYSNYILFDCEMSLSYVIDHPAGENWIPVDDMLRALFVNILTTGRVGRWEIITRDGLTVRGYVKDPYMGLERVQLPNQMTEILRYGSQKYPFIYNICVFKMYSDSTGQQKPEFIIERPDLTTTNLNTLGYNGKYTCDCSWDTNRPQPDFLKTPGKPEPKPEPKKPVSRLHTCYEHKPHVFSKETRVQSGGRGGHWHDCTTCMSAVVECPWASNKTSRCAVCNPETSDQPLPYIHIFDNLGGIKCCNDKKHLWTKTIFTVDEWVWGDKKPFQYHRCAICNMSKHCDKKKYKFLCDTCDS